MTKVKLRIWMKSGVCHECYTNTEAKDTGELFTEILGKKREGFMWFVFMLEDKKNNIDILLNEVDAIEYLGEVKGDENKNDEEE